MTNRSALDIIKENDPRVVGELFRTDEAAIVLLEKLGHFLGATGYVLSDDRALVFLEIMRTTYYLGYKRGKLAASMPEFVVQEEKEGQT